jgi:glycerol-3-phosphate acyltransferase PlsY
MEILLTIGVIIAGYLLGCVPWGMVIVKLRTGLDVRKFESGRTGGTNVGRVAGFWAGVLTAFLDGLKGALAVWLAIWLLPAVPIAHVLAGVAAILGHNYSIFLLERTPNGVRLRGGAGGATTVGAAFGLWWPSFFIVVPSGAIVVLVIGYASLATLTVGIASTIIYGVRALLGAGPWEYMLYGILATALLVWALRPNIRRLLNGTERLVGIRARRKKASLIKEQNNHPAAQN